MENTAFSSIDFVVMCLLDKERTQAFERSIRATVKEGDHVLELGTGSGILSMFAARQGAGKVTAIEYDPYIADVARKNVRENGLESIVEIVVADARNHTFDSSSEFDVVIAELLTTGMVDEFQVEGINNLHRQSVVTTSTIFIPAIQKTYAQLCSTDFTAYGFNMKMVTHIWRFYRSVLEYPIIRVGERQLVDTTNFSETSPAQCEAQLQITATETALVNSIYLTSESILPGNIVLGATEFLNGDVLIPLDTERSVTKGEVIQLSISYEFGHGYENFSAKVL